MSNWAQTVPTLGQLRVRRHPDAESYSKASPLSGASGTVPIILGIRLLGTGPSGHSREKGQRAHEKATAAALPKPQAPGFSFHAVKENFGDRPYGY
jgi:hypothetical protein